ncbi:acid protease [Xylariaceae sp. AK1471]|nr:acid protease [Xylariaceae sp. AK1471]
MRSVAKFATGSLLASVASAQVVQWDIVRKENAAPKLSKRADGTVQEVITNERMRGGYFASCSVGTPPQDVTLQLDTGSSDIWVPASDASVCQSTAQGGCTFGSFNPDKSSTFEILNEDFNISYVDGSGSAGDYISDTFGIGNVKLPNTTMGLGLDTDIAYGLVGVGYFLNEAAQQPYPNLPIVMRDEGYIATNAYSLWLNDLDSSTGSILFGGIDTDKYEGDLTRLNIYKDPQTGVISSFIVALTSLQATSSSGNDELSSLEYPIAAVLDSGTTFSYLPQDLAQQVWEEVGAIYYSASNGGGVPLVACALRNNKGYFSFGFGGDGGAVIKVSMDELVIPISTGKAIPLPSGPYAGQDACQFGILNTSTDPFLLGDTFLRSAYVVYDLENNEIGIAATDFNATTSNVVPFPSKGAEIPSSTPAPNQDSLPSGSSTRPNFSAMSGFMDISSSSNSGGSGSGNGGGNGGGDGNAASLPPALDITQFIIMGASMGLMVFGGGMFLLF